MKKADILKNLSAMILAGSMILALPIQALAVTANISGKSLSQEERAALALNEYNAKIPVNGQLTLIFNGTSAGRVVWTSSDENIASVKGIGKNSVVTGKKAGDVTISATYIFGSDPKDRITHRCRVTVWGGRKGSELYDITFENKNPANAPMTILVGETVQAIAVDQNGKQVTEGVVWEKPNSYMNVIHAASLDEKGKVTGIKERASSVTASWSDGENYITASIAINVIDSINLNQRRAEIPINGKLNLFIIAKRYIFWGNKEEDKPAGLSGKTTWKSSDSKVAVVDKNGTVTALKEGTAMITATYTYKTADGSEKNTMDMCTVTVNNAISNTTTTEAVSDNEETVVASKPATTLESAKNKKSRYIYSDNKTQN